MSKELRHIEERRQLAENELRELEKFIYKLETNYLRDSSVDGNILKGWEALISAKATKTSTYPATKKQNGRTVLNKDRVFSLSSATFPVKITEYDNLEIMIPSKRNPSMQGKAPKKSKKKNSDTDEYSEDVA
jgi:chromatin modification-related protein EAF6